MPAADAFCEACGAALVVLAEQAPAAPPDTCTKCGAAADAVDTDGYCTACGNRRRGQRRDHLTAAIAGAVAVSDRGIRHYRNEDAFALAHHDGRGLLALVVCDGVSSASRSDEAAQAAADAACRRLATVAAGADVEARAAAFRTAVSDAQRAVLGIEWPAPGRPPDKGDSAPSCTFVGALVGPDDITVGWVGDSRAYWVPTDPAAPVVALSTDHSWAAEQIAAGRDAATVMSEPGAHAITRWIGADQSGDPIPDVRTHRIAGPGRLLLCSDGLWNMVGDDAVHRLVDATTADEPAALTATAEALVAAANAAGGPDNITVIITTVRASASAPTTGGQP